MQGGKRMKYVQLIDKEFDTSKKFLVSDELFDEIQSKLERDLEERKKETEGL